MTQGPIYRVFGGGGYFIVAPRGRRHSREGDDTCRMVAVSVGRSEDTLKATFTRSLQARPTRPSDGLFHRLRRQTDLRPNVMAGRLNRAGECDS